MGIQEFYSECLSKGLTGEIRFWEQGIIIRLRKGSFAAIREIGHEEIADYNIPLEERIRYEFLELEYMLNEHLKVAQKIGGIRNERHKD